LSARAGAEEVPSQSLVPRFVVNRICGRRFFLPPVVFFHSITPTLLSIATDLRGFSEVFAAAEIRIKNKAALNTGGKRGRFGLSLLRSSGRTDQRARQS